MSDRARLRVAFRTLGCKVNQVESERIAAELLAWRCESVAEAEADIVVINTCTVTGEADRKARKEVRHALRLPREPIVVVTGCLAALDAEGLRALGERVVVEADKAAVAERVHASLELSVDPASGSGADLTCPPRRTRAQVMVEDGCDAYCAYCIVPYARGNPRPVPLARVVSEVEALVARGTAEVVLTGINIGRYDEGGRDLADVVLAVAATGIERIRLSSVEPMHLRGRLLETLASTPEVCPHLHLPLQAGSDRILTAMDRGYDTASFAAVAEEARAAIPGLALSTDVLVGFPGETPADAVATREFVERVGFMRLHVFRYSERPGTLAAKMPNRVDPRDKRIRSERLRELGDVLATRYALARDGGAARVPVERVESGVAEGTSEDYLKVRFEARDTRPGEVVPVTLQTRPDGSVGARW